MTTLTTRLTTRGAGAVLALAGQPDLPVVVLLRHCAQEPAALRVVVLLDDEESVELLLERRLVTAGLTGHPCAGEVQVAVHAERAAITIGALTLTLELADLVEALLASYAAAPTGAEADRVVALEARARELSQT